MVLVVPEQSQRPYRFGMTLLCVGALFNWLGLADTYSDPVPAIRYIGVGLIAAGASLICMAMCFWMRNIHDPSTSSDYDITSDPVHVISSDPSLEKPPEYSTVVDVPPCYEDAIKLNATPLVFRLKHALTSTTFLINHNSETNRTASKNYADQSHSLGPSSAQVTDNQNFYTLPAEATPETQKPMSAGTSYQSQNSSHNENTIGKVFRKSIRGIRRFRSDSEDSNSSLEQSSNLENELVQGTNHIETPKINR